MRRPLFVFRRREISAKDGERNKAALHKGLFDNLEAKVFRPISSLRADFGMSDNNGQSDDDASIVSRAVAAYRRDDNEDLSKPSSMWEHIFNARHIPIHKTLTGNDDQAIQRLFRRPSDSDLFYGFDGLVADFVNAMRAASKEARTNYAKVPHDHLLRAAELMGALPYENRDGWFVDPSTLQRGFMATDHVIDALDAYFGVPLEFKNPFADEYGTQTKRGVISLMVPQALYHAWRGRELVKGIARPRILEIGGGLGRAAYFAWQMGIKDYTIIDLPLSGLSQANFLMRVIGEENVVLQGEDAAASSAKIKLLKPSAFLEGELSRYDLIINANSMTEMSRETAERYWNRIRKATSRFLSINHESNPFTVREIAEAHAEYVKASQRHTYGMRKSYAEELFEFF